MPQAERRALEQLVQIEPGDCAAWARLAVLAAQAGRKEDAVQLRRHKTEMDRAMDRYRYLYNRNQYADDVPELARLAQTLGRRFEAVGFLTWMVRREPGNADARSALARLNGIETRPIVAGRTLAQVLAADLAPQADWRPAGAEARRPRPTPVPR